MGKCNIIWNKVSADVKKEFNRKPVYHKNVLETKIRSYGVETTNFYDKEVLKVESNHTFLTAVSLNSALKKDKYYYLQAFLKECKYIEKIWLDILLMNSDNSDEK